MENQREINDFEIGPDHYIPHKNGPQRKTLYQSLIQLKGRGETTPAPNRLQVSQGEDLKKKKKLRNASKGHNPETLAYPKMDN